MARTGPQKYPGASTAYWYGNRYEGAAMEVNVAVWHTTEGTSVPTYGGGAAAPTLTANPDFGAKRLRWYQHFDIDQSARALVDRAGGITTNRNNAVQVELVGTCDPATHRRWVAAGRQHIFWPEAPDWALREVAKFVRWLHANHGVPLTSTVRWRAYPASYGTGAPQRLSSAAFNAYTGHLGHQHVPEGNDHGDPGDIDMAKILAYAKVEAAPKPAPAPSPSTPPKEPSSVPTPYVNLGRTEPMPVLPGGWDAIEFDTEWTDEPGAHAEGGSVFVKGPARFHGEVNIRAVGLPPGARLKMQLAEVDGNGKYVHEHPEGGITGVNGPYVADRIPINGRIGTGRGMRVRVMHDVDGAAVTITSVLKVFVEKES